MVTFETRYERGDLGTPQAKPGALRILLRGVGPGRPGLLVATLKSRSKTRLPVGCATREGWKFNAALGVALNDSAHRTFVRRRTNVSASPKLRGITQRFLRGIARDFWKLDPPLPIFHHPLHGIARRAG